MSAPQAGSGRRLGILGGTFDPPHLGHLAVARAARQQLGLDQVWLMVAARPVHKAGVSRLAHRLSMAALAAASECWLEASDLEARREGPSYTVDTLRSVRGMLGPDAEIVFLAGSDVEAELAGWREPQACLELARFVVVGRPGVSAAPGPAARRLDRLAVTGPELSSTLVRARAAAGHDIRRLVPDAVARYVEAHGLYRRRQAA